MVVIKHDIFESPKDTKKAALKLACHLFDINIVAGKERNDVKVKVGHLMEAKVLGRITPSKKNRGPGIDARNRPVPFNSPFKDCYPRKLVTNAEKKKYLITQLERREMKPQIFDDLMSVMEDK